MENLISIQLYNHISQEKIFFSIKDTLKAFDNEVFEVYEVMFLYVKACVFNTLYIEVKRKC